MVSLILFRISGEYISYDHRFKNIFILFIIVVHLVTVKKIIICCFILLILNKISFAGGD